MYLYTFTCICICACTYLHICIYTYSRAVDDAVEHIYFSSLATQFTTRSARIDIHTCISLWMLSFGSPRYVRACVCVSHISMYIYPDTNIYCSLLATQSNMKNDSELTFENLFADACFRSNGFSNSVTHCDTYCTHSNIYIYIHETVWSNRLTHTHTYTHTHTSPKHHVYFTLPKKWLRADFWEFHRRWTRVSEATDSTPSIPLARSSTPSLARWLKWTGFFSYV